MDDSKTKTLDELLAQLNTIDLSDNIVQGASGSDWITSDTISISSPTYTMSDTSYSAIPGISITGGVTGQNTIWTTNTTGPSYTIGSIGSVNPMTVDQGGMVSLKGEKADIDINGKSLKAWMEKVEERLNILTPNPELEAEWDDLRRLGERYRKLEKKCKEKAEVWNKLKSMPKPNIKL